MCGRTISPPRRCRRVTHFAGTVDVDLMDDPLGKAARSTAGFTCGHLADAPNRSRGRRRCLAPEMFRKRYADVFKGDDRWRRSRSRPASASPGTEPRHTCSQPPYFDGMTRAAPVADNPKGARVLAVLGDSVTTDHISPAGAIKKTPPGITCSSNGVSVSDFNSLRLATRQPRSHGPRHLRQHPPEERAGAGHRRRLDAVSPHHGRRSCPTTMPQRNYARPGNSLVILAGKDYGMGSSRDWAAKGLVPATRARAVIAESFERIHRSNLVGMGVLPLQFSDGRDRRVAGPHRRESLSRSPASRLLND